MRQRLRHASRIVGLAVIAVLGAGCALLGIGPVTEEPAPASPAPATPTPTPSRTPAPTSTPTVPPSPAPDDYAGAEDLIVAAVAEQTGYPESLVRSYLRSYMSSQGYTVESYLAAARIAPDEVDDLIAEARSRGIDTPEEFYAFLTEVINRPPA
jgi:hypothetical protein